MVAPGDVEDLSANAAVMLKVSVLAAWAELQIASMHQSYLTNVVRPYRWLLGPFWIGALRDYAQLRTDPEMGVGAAAAGFDFNNGLGRDILLPVSESKITIDYEGLTGIVLRASRVESVTCHCNFARRFRLICPWRHGRTIIYISSGTKFYPCDQT